MIKNRFFADRNSSSSEDNSDDEEQIQVQTATPEIFYASYNAGNDDEEDVKRVVRSEKEKRYEEIEEVIKTIQQVIRIRDINRVYECFQTLIKAYDKARRVIEKEQKIPQFYQNILVELDNFVNQCWKDQDGCNTTNSNNLNRLRQKLRRYLKEQPLQNDDELIDIDPPSISILLNEEEISKKLDEIISMRGKRGINYENQLESLNILRQQNLSFEILMKILLTQITVSLDYHHQGKLEIWTRALDYMEELSENINLKLTSDSIDDDLIAVILQMDEELTRIFQNTDPHSQDYIDRLKDEFRFCSILDRFKHYFECRNQSQHLCSIYLCIIERIYYKSSIESIDCLWEYISMHDTFNRARTRASLCYIYYLALHDSYHQARDLMLMCHLQDTIHLSDISTQILYNRTMVQLGLCAFRFGAMEEAHQALVDLQSGNRIKELLGQKIDRIYFLPYHMHINLQFIEWIYYISAMLIEIPWRSKYYHILMKQPILGPPESMRDHIVAASHALKIGDWKACVEFLMKEKMWKLIPQAMPMLINKIKEKSLRIYLTTYATSFSAISIRTLADRFELPIKEIYGIISKMIINQELMASIEESNQIVMIHETNLIQTLSVELMEKIFRLYEQNEKLNRYLK